MRLLHENLLEAFVRLVRLVASPTHTRMPGPLITRENFYWLLIGEQGSWLRHLALRGHAPDIIQVVKRLRQHFNQPLRIEEMAQDLGMSVSGFHRHFKAATTLSPLQFQKQLHLQEAHRPMLSENLDATSAAYRVGYRTPPTSIANIEASLASLPRAMCNGYEAKRSLSLDNEKDDTLRSMLSPRKCHYPPLCSFLYKFSISTGSSFSAGSNLKTRE